MSPKRPVLRSTALVAAGAFALHELRYLVGYPVSSEQTLAAQGHGYLSILGPLVVLIVGLAAGQLVASVARGSGRRARGTGFARIWLRATAALLSIYVVQEWLEGSLTAGHPDGLAGVFGAGGWSAFVLAVAIGAVIALALREVDGAIVLPSRRALPAGRARLQPHHRPARADLPSAGILARNLAGRAPPLSSA